MFLSLMIIKYCSVFFLVTLIAITKVANAQSSRQGTLDYHQESTWIYESENTDGTKTFYDRGKYRIDMGKLENYHVYYFDRTVPYIVWDYNPAKKTANPTRESLMYFFGSVVKKYGLKKLKETYKIPDYFPESRILPEKYGFLRVPFYWQTGLYQVYPVFPSVALTMKDYYHSKGTAIVANQKCYVFEDRHEGSVTVDYVEPNSRLVLRTESEFTSNPRMPARKSVESAKMFRFLKEMPADKFKLPAGTTVILPEIMKDMPLPPNIKRKILTGPNKEFGFSFEEMDRMIKK
jgi:hypothetical protein